MTGQTYPEYHSHLRNLLGKLARSCKARCPGLASSTRRRSPEGALSAKVKELIALPWTGVIAWTL